MFSFGAATFPPALPGPIALSTEFSLAPNLMAVADGIPDPGGVTDGAGRPERPVPHATRHRRRRPSCRLEGPGLAPNRLGMVRHLQPEEAA